MKIIAVNGSARKNWNTHILLNKALEGAESAGAQTELINLYDLEYKGCTGCLGCKAKASKSRGHCVVNDDLKPILDRIDKSNGLILGSPIYLGDITAMLRAFWERFIFQYLSYDSIDESLFHGNLKTAFIYTMNATTENTQDGIYQDIFNGYEGTLNRYFEYTGTILSTETLQMEDYSKYHMALLNEAQRKERREKVFPDDCQKAYDLGKTMAKE
ncbi:MAG: flavodoxin family protein [Fibrobacter sp.]|nr:flavodoxin family protein [Fibrobacter sp.]